MSIHIMPLALQCRQREVIETRSIFYLMEEDFSLQIKIFSHNEKML